MNVSVLNITDLPDDILIEIILKLNARERVRLCYSCKRFHNLVFEEKTLLRDLNFAEDGYLTKASDIFRYVNNESTNKHILKLNLENVESMNRDDLMFFKYISRAINLVELNIHGIEFTSQYQLIQLLKSLPHIRRLSIDFPEGEISNESHARTLRKQFSKLTYLSVVLQYLSDSNGLYRAIQFSQDLKELHITIISDGGAARFLHTVFDMELKSLEIVEYYGPCPRTVAEYFVSILSHPQEWTYFELGNRFNVKDGFYLGRNVEVCEELLECKSLKRLSYNYPQFASQLGGFVVSLCLLREVMTVNQRNLPEKLCCFPSATNEDEGQLRLPSVLESSKLWTLKIEETKRLLRHPRYPISSLKISHNIEQECDAHIVTSAFPSLTELVLSNITKNNRKTSDKTTDLNRRPERSALPHKPDDLPNLDSSFSKLVESTPHLRSLTIIANRSQLRSDETWDLTALHSIARWKDLTSLCLDQIPIADGKFLIEIGKQCRNLENLELRTPGPQHPFCYRNALLGMLLHCRNLRKFTLHHNNIGHLSDYFRSLANNQELRRVCIESNDKTRIASDLTPSIEYLIHRCSRLNSLDLSISIPKTEYNVLMSTLDRLTSDWNREIDLDISRRLCCF